MILFAIFLNHLSLILIKIIAKILSTSVTDSLILFARNFLTSIILIIIAYVNRQLSISKEYILLYIMRSIFQALSIKCGYAALRLGSISNVTLIGLTEPLFVAFLGYFILNERFTYKRIGCMLGCSAGFLILGQDTKASMDLWSIVYILLANFFAACSIIISKPIVIHDGILRSSAITGILVAMIFCIMHVYDKSTHLQCNITELSQINLILIILSALFTLFHRYAFLYVLRATEISYLAVFQYLGILLSIILSLIIDNYQFGINIGINTIFGAIIILLFLYFS